MTHKKLASKFCLHRATMTNFSLNYMCRARERNFSFVESFFKLEIIIIKLFQFFISAFASIMNRQKKPRRKSVKINCKALDW